MDAPPAISQPARPDAPLHFRRRHRLSGARAFGAVYSARVRKRRGPLTVFARPNDLDHSRLGLSVGKRVGGAVARNAVKRRVREAFRTLQHDAELPMDLVVNVAPHDPAPMDRYREQLRLAWTDLEHEWRRRSTDPERPR